MRRKNKMLRRTAVFVAVNFMAELIFPSVSFALTGGPNSPEATGFQPAGTTEMVDPFTGDFKYNISLLDVGGYPIAMNYSAGITPDQEASWVGLGWNLNLGSVNRSVRGIPDDFAGDEMKTEHSMKPNETFGVTFQATGDNKKEIATFEASLSQKFNISYNTYTGYGFSYSFSPSFDIAKLSGEDSPFELGANLGLGLSVGSEEGVGISPKVGLSTGYTKNNRESSLDASIGFPYSSREGVKGMSMSASFNNTSSEAYAKKYPAANNFAASKSVGGFSGFTAQTYPTNINYNSYSVNATLNFAPEKVKGLIIDDTKIVLGGYYSGQFDENEEEVNPAYGYMYEGATTADNAVLDFNREKDRGYNELTTNMPVTNHTYDIFSASAEGLGGSFRLFRSDVGNVGDNKSTKKGVSPDLALSLGKKLVTKKPGDVNAVKLGIDIKYIQSDAKSGRWGNGDRVQRFENPVTAAEEITQNVYFGQIGDMSPENNPDYYNKTLLGDELYEYQLKNGFVTGNYLTQDGATGDLVKSKDDENYIRNQRRNRTNSFNYLTAKQAEKHNLSSIYSYVPNNFTLSQNVNRKGQNKVNDIYGTKVVLPRVDDTKKADHISEIRVTNGSGQRFVYGVPVYNKTQKDATFSVEVENPKDKPSGSDKTNLEIARATGLVDYEDDDASTKNKKGLDHYYQKTIQPAHAASYLLTYVLSSDYVDSDDIEGPSDGDLGTYVKFNYSRTSTKYKWRTPFGENEANYADGLTGKRNDDKGSYSYGEKELWYVHSMETRTHVAEFYLSERLDGLGVKDEEGGLAAIVSDNNKQQKIDKIVLYAKRDLLNGNPEPLKTVHFDYSYQLCPGTPNSKAPNQGKLTLEKVWFTYGNSDKGEENPYKFYYGDADFDGVIDNELNPDYNKKNYDRWGTFKEEKEEVTNDEYPYTLQDKDETDRYVAVYSMNRILTPNGGDIRVHYESDDYAYVQNKQAMRMFSVLGVDNEDSTSISDLQTNLYNTLSTNPNPYLYIDLSDGFEATSLEDAKEIFKEKYLKNIEVVQYRANVKVLQSINNQKDAFENISGYCEFEESVNVLKKDANSNTYNIGVIQLKGESLNKGGTKSIHPFVKNAWLYGRMHYNRELMGSYDGDDFAMLQILGAIGSSVSSVLSFVFGFKSYMIAKGHGKELDPTKSFIRLDEPDKVKLGGGCRVKAIIMFDRWDEMTAQRESISGNQKEAAGYGQVYDYTMTEEGATISSGIAAYEPIIGGDENPWRRLVKTVDKVPLAPNKEYYTETPFGESFFPSPSVGYRKVKTIPVKVTSKNYQVDQLVSNGTGYVEDEFYTAYDFPTKVTYTGLDPYREKSADFNPLKMKSIDYVYCSQGYLIELNDMHGKPKSKKVMPDKTTGDVYPVSLVRYEYQTEKDNPQQLNCEVPLVTKDMQVIDETGRELGTTVDVVNDTRAYESITRGGGIDVNVKINWTISPAPPVPVPLIPFITALPEVNYESTKFFSITTTKVVNRYGVLKKTIAYENGQNITTENLAWDAVTGQTLLTKVDNEFHNEIFNFTFPAHWAYEQMGLAYENDGLRFKNIANVVDYLKDGDEILVERDDIGVAPYLLGYYDAVQGKLLDKEGDEITNFDEARVIRSGARNVPTVAVGSVSLLDNPMVNQQIVFEGKTILNTGATEFKNIWKGFCNCGEQEEPERNPFISGERGQLRAWRSWTYLTGRTQENINGELNIRRDGGLTDYDAFWQPSTQFLQPFYTGLTEEEIDQRKWQYVVEVENFNPLGQEIENKDALNRFSMAQYGYGRSLPTGVSNNSKYNESAVDGFEDYDYDDCNDDHFSWRVRANDANTSLTHKESHTGQKSLKVAPSSSTKIVKTINTCENR